MEAEAAEKFALAAKNAPAWGRARLDWAEALWLAGDRGAAATQLKEASTRTLSEADRVFFGGWWPAQSDKSLEDASRPTGGTLNVRNGRKQTRAGKVNECPPTCLFAGKQTF